MSRLRSAPKRGRIPLLGRSASEQLDKLKLIIHPTELGIKFVPFHEAEALGEKFLRTYPRNPSYEEFDPNAQEFFTTQDTLRLDAVRHYIEYPDIMFGLSVDAEPRMFRFTDSSLLIVDGNHRVAAAMIAGRTIEVCVSSTAGEAAVSS